MNLSAELDRWLPEGMSELLLHTGSCARKLGHRAYLVGGPVRDLLLGRPCFDLDVVIEGDAVAVARVLAGQGGAAPVVHRAFGTASIKLGAFRVDLVTARAESYERPGALPSVRPGGIAQDLARRDFSINAMALLLDGGERGELLDPHHGWRDLSHGLVRVLHERSFVDDATRMLRGVRYEQRFGFVFESRTQSLLQQGLQYVAPISGDRLRHEFERTFEEAEPEHAMQRMDALGILHAVHAALRFDGQHAAAFSRARRLSGVPVQAATLYWGVLAWALPPSELDPVARRLNLPRRLRELMVDAIVLRALESSLEHPSLTPAELCCLLEGRSLAALAVAELMFVGVCARERVSSYLHRLRHVRCLLSGSDLCALGVPEGPEVGRLLSLLRTARLNGEVTSREDELALLHRLRKSVT